MQVASDLEPPRKRLTVGPREVALRRARTCYDGCRTQGPRCDDLAKISQQRQSNFYGHSSVPGAPSRNVGRREGARSTIRERDSREDTSQRFFGAFHRRASKTSWPKHRVQHRLPELLPEHPQYRLHGAPCRPWSDRQAALATLPICTRSHRPIHSCRLHLANCMVRRLDARAHVFSITWRGIGCGMTLGSMQ